MRAIEYFRQPMIRQQTAAVAAKYILPDPEVTVKHERKIKEAFVNSRPPIYKCEDCGRICGNEHRRRKCVVCGEMICAACRIVHEKEMPR